MYVEDVHKKYTKHEAMSVASQHAYQEVAVLKEG